MPGPVNSNSLTRYINTIPRVFNPELNRVMYAFLYAIALSDDDVETAIATAKNDLFVATATGQNLNKLANSLGVQRPPGLGLNDTEFSSLIPNLSLKPKTIRKAFYDTADVFWGPLFSRANLTSNNFAPFNLHVGDGFTIAVDGGAPQSIKILPGELASPGFATADEVVAILSRINGITPSILTDILTGDQTINIRTNTPGPVGKVNIITDTGFSTLKLDFNIGTVTILNLSQRVSIYNINPNELIIEIPSIVPALRRTLEGSHHFHADATLQPPIPPADGQWVGSFFYNPDGTGGQAVTISRQKSLLQAPITRGQVYTSIPVDSNTTFLEASGEVIFDFGLSDSDGKVLQEGPVKYRGLPNSNTILLDPSYTFKSDHSVGAQINVVTQNTQYIPRKTGNDYAIYLTSPSGAREVVQEILESLVAAGVTIKFIVLAPKYKYIIDNPYLPESEPVENPNDP